MVNGEREARGVRRLEAGNRKSKDFVILRNEMMKNPG
jgi:hypothetical protein